VRVERIIIERRKAFREAASQLADLAARIGERRRQTCANVGQEAMSM
jgi:hypothetical protein